MSNELSQKCGAGMYWCNTDKKCKAMPNEDAPVNAVGGGAIAGTGVGPQGEPGIKRKKTLIPRVSSFITYMKGRNPKLT
jgi:hypothetical protein